MPWTTSEIRWPLVAPTWDKAETEALHRIIDSGDFTMGRHVVAFEEDFASHVGSRYAVMVNSGSGANLLMAAILRWVRPYQGSGPEIIVPALGWATSYYPFAEVGYLRFVDIEPYTLNYDLGQLKDAINSRTAAIVCVNILGNPNDFDAVRQVAGDIPIIVDNCESLGATFHGREAGTYGLMGSYSFFYSHHISTMEGGMVVTDDEEVYHGLLSMRSHGWTRHLPKENRLCTKGDNPFEESYRFILPGYNLRPGEMHGAAGLCQLAKLPQFISQRRHNARQFQAFMQDYPEIRVQREIGRSSWFGFSMVVEPWSRFSRDDLLNRLSECGIETRPVVTGNFVRQEATKHLRIWPKDPKMPNADFISANGLMIGNNHSLSPKAFEALEEALAPLCRRSLIKKAS